MFIAIHHTTRQIIARAASYRECSEQAFATGLWADYDAEQGSASPYFITTEQFL